MARDFAFKDYYLILNISTGAGDQELRTAFRKLARETHPDLTGDAGNYEKFILIREAYDILSDRNNREAYDAMYRAWQAGSGGVGEADGESSYNEFDPTDNRAYGEEWEYFKLHPDDYLDLFRSSIRMFLAGFISIFAGALTPLVVFSVIMGIVILFLLMMGTIIGAFITTSLSSVAGIIIAILVYRKVRSLIAGIEIKGVSFFGRMVVYPLRGIPVKYGKTILYLNYIMIFIITAGFGYTVVNWFYDKLPTDSLPQEKQVFAVGALLFLIVFSVVVIVFSLVLIYEIVVEALKRYPKIRYTRIRVKKRKVIGFSAKPAIREDRT